MGAAVDAVAVVAEAGEAVVEECHPRREAPHITTATPATLTRSWSTRRTMTAKRRRTAMMMMTMTMKMMRTAMRTTRRTTGTMRSGVPGDRPPCSPERTLPEAVAAAPAVVEAVAAEREAAEEAVVAVDIVRFCRQCQRTPMRLPPPPPLRRRL